MVLLAEGSKQQVILEAEANKTREVLQAEADKQKLILAAEAEREQLALIAQGKKDAFLLESEGEKIAKINLAEGEAARILKELLAQAEGLASISAALNAQGSNQSLLALKSLESAVAVAGKIADGQATKIFLPQESSGLIGSLLSIAEGFKTVNN